MEGQDAEMLMTMERAESLFGLRNVSMRGDGVNILASCPYAANHRNGDAHPSFSINLDLGVYICYGCGEKGNLVKLAQDVLGMTTVQAYDAVYGDLSPEEVSRLIDGRQMPGRPSGGVVAPLEADILEWARNETGYWAWRGFAQQTVGEWMLGYDPLSNRAVVPVRFKGEFVGWSKRRLDERDSPKWLHFKGMDRSRTLFGYDRADGRSCVVVEAPLSVVMLDQQGIKGAVATFGCEMSQGQADIIRARYDSVTMFYDPDEAGRKGTERALKMLAPFCDVKVVPQTRDDPAAMTFEENSGAIENAVPSWAYESGFVIK